jgi:hypothetical protein
MTGRDAPVALPSLVAGSNTRRNEEDRTMKAALINEVGRGFDNEDIEISAPAGREVLVEVRASGLCHSDLTVATHGMGYLTPAVWGHEVVGVVTDIGPRVTVNMFGAVAKQTGCKGSTSDRRVPNMTSPCTPTSPSAAR